MQWPARWPMGGSGWSTVGWAANQVIDRRWAISNWGQLLGGRLGDTFSLTTNDKSLSYYDRLKKVWFNYSGDKKITR